jgi:hypothetical protein
MDIFITYDVTHKQPEVKAALKKLEYLDTWTSNNTTYYLPDTSLWRKNAVHVNDGLTDIESVIAEINRSLPEREKVILKRCIVVPAHPWAGIPGNNDRP